MMKEITNIFYCLSDKNRIRILMMLSRRTLCVCEITDILELSASTVSNHLSILKSAGFILDSKDGKWVNYSLNTETKDPKIQQILLMLPMWLNTNEIINSDIAKITESDRKILCSNSLLSDKCSNVGKYYCKLLKYRRAFFELEK